MAVDTQCFDSLYGASRFKKCSYQVEAIEQNEITMATTKATI